MLVAPGANPEVNGTPDPNRPEGAKLSLSHPFRVNLGRTTLSMGFQPMATHINPLRGNNLRLRLTHMGRCPVTDGLKIIFVP